MLPYWMERYPQIAGVVRNVADVIHSLPSLSEAEKLPSGVFELESRFGTHNSVTGDFQTGVSRQFFQQTLRLFQQYEDWQKITPWQEVVDYFYEVKLKTTNVPVTVRTSVFVDSETRELKTQHIRKHAQKKVDIQTNCQRLKLYDIRVSLNYEETLPSGILPSTIQPSFVRIKNRQRFWYARERVQDPLWVFDMTRSWSGKTKTEVEQAQKMDKTIYEIECEALNPVKYFNLAKQDELYASASLLLKTTRLFDVDESCYALELRDN